MKLYNSKFFAGSLIMAATASMLLACNKDLPQAQPIVPPTSSGATIVETINTDADFSILKAAIARAGTSLTALLSDKSGVYSFFAPPNSAFQAIGITSEAMLAAFRPGQLDTILRYHLVGGQELTAAVIPTSFPNVQEPSAFVLAPPSATLPPGLRMPVFPSKRGTTLWLNNIPVTQADIDVANGVIHKIAVVAIPPSQYLWNRIDTAVDLTYLKAAILRADSGSTATSSLKAALLNPAANLTVFAPNNTAFQQVLTAQITMALIPVVTQQLINGGVPPDQAAAQAPAIAQAQATTIASTPDVFNNPALFGVLTAQTVKGLVVYHLLGSRAFTVNMPTTATNVPTLLNTVVTSHPGVTLQATFGVSGVTAATVKGLANATASNILINPFPGGTSDQNYINGVLHKIDQVLRPQ